MQNQLSNKRESLIKFSRAQIRIHMCKYILNDRIVLGLALGRLWGCSVVAGCAGPAAAARGGVLVPLLLQLVQVLVAYVGCRGL